MHVPHLLAAAEACDDGVRGHRQVGREGVQGRRAGRAGGRIRLAHVEVEPDARGALRRDNAHRRGAVGGGGRVGGGAAAVWKVEHGCVEWGGRADRRVQGRPPAHEPPSGEARAPTPRRVAGLTVACLAGGRHDGRAAHDLVATGAAEREGGHRDLAAEVETVGTTRARTPSSQRLHDHRRAHRVSLNHELLAARPGVDVGGGLVDAEADAVGEDTKIEQEPQPQRAVALGTPREHRPQIELGSELERAGARGGLVRMEMPGGAEILRDGGDVDAAAVHGRQIRPTQRATPYSHRK